MPSIGQLDRRVTLMRPTVVVDPEYGPQPGWEVFVARAPAQVLDVLPSRDTEGAEGRIFMAHRPARVRMRYLRDLTSDMQMILHGETDVVYEITGGPAEMGRRDWTEFMVKVFSS